MELIINKIGKIKDANIKVNGLTVIAGKNDTGKSTVGKVLYALLRALGTYSEFFANNQLTYIRQNLLLPLLQKVNAVSVPDVNFSKEIGSVIDYLRKPAFLRDKEKLTEANILNLLEKIREAFAEQLPTEVAESVDAIITHFEKMRETSDATKARLAFDFHLKSIFSSIINNSKYHEEGSIGVINQEYSILQTVVANNDVTDFKLEPIKAKSLYGKPIYIESPFVLEKVFAFDKPNWENLMYVFRDANKASDRISINTDMLEFIQKTIFQQAKFSFDSETNDFCYQVDSDSSKLTLLDVASGIKSFALIFSLLKKDYLTKDSLLILDEPENHLHPEWQIKYAEMVSLLVSKEFSVVLTSHSPTFIQALAAYERKYNINEKTSFYLAEKIEGQNYSTLTDVTDNIERISENLVEPMDKLFLGV